MKAILEFSLPEEREEHEVAVHGMEWKIVCEDMDNQLRSWLKHGNEFTSIDEALETVRTQLHNFMIERGLELF